MDHAELVELVHELEQECDALERRCDVLENRIEELERSKRDSECSSEGLSLDRGDHRDEAVLELLTPGEKVSPARFHELYRNHTDLLNRETIAKRVENLVSGPEFEGCGSRIWEYRPGEYDR